MRAKHYIPGDNYVIDDITGLKIRASEARHQWNGLLTNKADHSPRHPQEFVRGLTDQQRAAVTRPQPVPVLGGPYQTATAAPADIGATSIPVLAANVMVTGDRISIVMANAEVFQTQIDFIDGNTVHLAAPLPYRVDQGALVTDYSAISEPSF